MPAPWVIKAPFYGKWSMKVTGINSARKQHIVIETETSGIEQTLDSVVVGQSVADIDFPHWYVLILSSGDGPGAQASRIRPVPGVIDPDGLITTLYANDTTNPVVDEDFDDLIVQFTYLDPEVNPPGVPRHPFIMPTGRVRPPRHGRDKPRCECVCGCRAPQRCRCGR